MDKLSTYIASAIRPIKARIQSVVFKGVLENIKESDGLPLGKVNLLSGGSISDVEIIQDYGFSSVPPKDSECACVSVGGAKDNSIAIKVGSAQYRLKGLENGEVAISTMWNGSNNQHCIILKKDGTVVVNAETLIVSGNLEVSGEIKATGEITTGSLALSTHIHKVPSAPGFSDKPFVVGD